LDGKIYIGSHKTKKLDDEYMGSGKYLLAAQKKYGIENFTKEILFVFDNSKDMYAKEAEIVNEDFLATENTYNLKKGGFGGWDYLNETGLNNSSKTKEQLQKGGFVHAEKLKKDLKDREEHSKKSGERLKKLHQEGKIKYNTFLGKKHSAETKEKISHSHKQNKKSVGIKNSQYGTTWIWCKELGNKKIKKELLNEYLEKGWTKTYKPGYKV
jgi:hypothetical protein